MLRDDGIGRAFGGQVMQEDRLAQPLGSAHFEG
jgi:hypothetical protein